MTDTQRTTDTGLFVVKGERNEPQAYQAVAFAEPPEWSPFLPTPGTYHHPVYGDLDFSPDAYNRIIDNFKTGVYQERIPVNAEHDPHAAGAVGWITDMRLAETGAIEAQVEWNDRGRALIEGDRYRYVSAEVMPSWTDPVDPERQYQDVAVGLALTTNPYFKERVLPPLAASEATLVRTAGNPGKEIAMGEEQKPIDQKPTAEKPEAVQLSEAEVNAFRTFQEAGGLTKLTELEGTVTKLGEENVKLRTDARTKRFKDIVLGKAEGSDGARWFGEPDKHVTHLVKLADAFGEDSEEVAHYVSVNATHAEQLKESGLFSAVGTGQGGGDAGKTAWERIEAKAVEFAEASKVTKAEAVKHVLETDRELAAAYEKER